jgi:hypothetical protein
VPGREGVASADRNGEVCDIEGNLNIYTVYFKVHAEQRKDPPDSSDRPLPL